MLARRYYVSNWRHQMKWMPLWKKGEHTVKQPVHVSDFAAGVVAAARDPDTDGKIFQAVGLVPCTTCHNTLQLYSY